MSTKSKWSMTTLSATGYRFLCSCWKVSHGECIPAMSKLGQNVNTSECLQMVLLSAVRDLFATSHLIEPICGINMFGNGLAVDIFALLEIHSHRAPAGKNVTRHLSTFIFRHCLNGICSTEYHKDTSFSILQICMFENLSQLPMRWIKRSNDFEREAYSTWAYVYCHKVYCHEANASIVRVK